MNDDSINAFAGPYGYIGVHTGMLLSSDSESELAGVLSHEISHVTQNHLNRFSEKIDKHTYIMVAGMLAAVLVDNSDASQAIVASTVDINLLPVWLQKASISFTEPASVEITSKIFPAFILESAFLVFKIGNGQFKPDASKVSSAMIGTPYK